MSKLHYLYCIAPAGHEPRPDLRGVEDAPVVALGAGVLCVWASAHARAPAASGEAIRTHHAVNEAALTERVTPVPLRFGQAIRDPARVALLLETDGERWRSLLAEFSGCLEYGVRVLVEDGVAEIQAPVTPTIDATLTPGRRHMAELAARTRVPEHARPMLASVRRETAGLVRRERVDPLHTPRGVATIAHLVERTVAPAYRERLERAAAGQPAYRLLFSGPWPPYSFV